MTRTQLLAILGVAFLLGLVYNSLFFNKLPGISFPLFVALIILGLVALAHVFRQNLPRQTILLALPLLFFATMVFVRASGALIALNILASFVLLILLAVSVLGPRLNHYLMADYVKLVMVPFSILGTALRTTAASLAMRATSNAHSRTPHIVIGIGLALPILALFIILFSSADLVFAKYVSDVVNIQINMETVARILLVLAVTFALTGAYAYALGARKSHLGHEQPQTRSLALLTSAILLGSVNALFLTFVAIQITYLFGGQANIAGQGFTYAEYARKGFFELLTVAVISFVIVLATEKYTVRGGSGHTRLFKCFSGLLVLQVLLIIVSAFKRLALYEQAYGFTMLRLLSHTFTIWLAVIFLLLLYKIFIDSSERRFLFVGFLSAIATLVALNVGNPDAFIARHNIVRYEDTGKLDTAYLSMLSEDALEPITQAFDVATTPLKDALGHQLYWGLSTGADSDWFNTWPSTNLARRQGAAYFKSHRGELAQYMDFQGEIPR